MKSGKSLAKKNTGKSPSYLNCFTYLDAIIILFDVWISFIKYKS